MEQNSNSDEQEQTLKPVYTFEFSNAEGADGDSTASEVRRTDELENDGPYFREEGIELLAQMGREDPECEVTLVGFTQIGA